MNWRPPDSCPIAACRSPSTVHPGTARWRADTHRSSTRPRSAWPATDHTSAWQPAPCPLAVVEERRPLQRGILPYMNRLHRWYCRSDHWRAVVTRDLFGWTLGDVVLGDDLLELGPGPGVTTRLLAGVAQQVTTVDIDMRRRAPAPMSNVRHVRGDATRLPFRSGRFSAVAAFTMLHHVRDS